MGDVMNYKMLALDLDGTLLNDEKQISDKNIKILNKLHDSNVEIVIATGRNYYMAKELIYKIKNVQPVILANNGAVVRRSGNNELLDFNYLDAFEFEKIYVHGLRYDLNPVLHVDEYFNGYDLIYERDDYEEAYKGYIKKDYSRAKLIKFIPNEINNILSVCYFDEYSRLFSFVEEMKGKVSNKYGMVCSRNISDRALLEFLHPDGSKWTALKKYAKSRNVAPNEIITMGDDNNDIDMLKHSGLGIAMKNGTKETAEAAMKVSRYNNNDSGIYYELSEILGLSENI